MKVMIVGQTGGLTAAIALRRAGVETTVFECAGELREVGAGLPWQRTPSGHSMSSASRKSSPARYPCFGRLILSWRGETLTDVPADELEKRLGAPAPPSTGPTSKASCCESLARRTCAWARRARVSSRTKRAVTLFVDGSEERGDALIGADGLNSTIRTSLFGGEKPRYAGYTAWRAVVEPSHELLPWGVGERSEVRLRPHRRGHSLLVRHQKRSRT